MRCINHCGVHCANLLLMLLSANAQASNQRIEPALSMIEFQSFDGPIKAHSHQLVMIQQSAPLSRAEQQNTTLLSARQASTARRNLTRSVPALKNTVRQRSMLGTWTRTFSRKQQLLSINRDNTYWLITWHCRVQLTCQQPPWPLNHIDYAHVELGSYQLNQHTLLLWPAFSAPRFRYQMKRQFTFVYHHESAPPLTTHTRSDDTVAPDIPVWYLADVIEQPWPVRGDDDIAVSFAHPRQQRLIITVNFARNHARFNSNARRPQ
ncbi:hypothetical protein ACFOD0_14720 [Shewanella intestini]|uniref:DUF3108 domain-containing protein n=1 Tax=Shewanella intestini TaxID=2017544 RepID=A0ABS5I686_9GAMM|nr:MULTISPECIES: hypothetical protein [Shewanella]MBR9729540.1 hypothetical protein [Shewanella intestini]MRG37519.1 hypothetical protein [Shewanella sp. XMDDZSB0408]